MAVVSAGMKFIPNFMAIRELVYTLVRCIIGPSFIINQGCFLILSRPVHISQMRYFGVTYTYFVSLLDEILAARQIKYIFPSDIQMCNLTYVNHRMSLPNNLNSFTSTILFIYLLVDVSYRQILNEY